MFARNMEQILGNKSFRWLIILVGPSQSGFVYGNANLEMFLPQIVDLCKRFLTVQTASDKEEGAARQHCAQKPLTSADPSGHITPKMVEI